MRSDPIVEEIRRFRQEHTDQFRGNLRAICDDLRRQERESGRRFVSRAPRQVQAVTTPPSVENGTQ